MVKMRPRMLFFDSPKVRRSLDKATRKVFSRFGAYVRTRARSSIKDRDGVSKPGHPPHSHTGHLKRFIYFGYDPQERSVVIGPIPLSERKAKDAPEHLEYGGVAVLKSRNPRRGRRSRRAVYKPRPFMGPAFEKEQPNLPAMWRASIT